MPVKKGREYRALQGFSLVPREGEADAYKVRGTAIVFDTPTCLFEVDGVKYYEVIDRHALDGCDLSDVIMNYNHGGKVVARLRNKTLVLTITDRGLDMEADLSGTVAGRDLYEEIDGGYIDKMSFSFAVQEAVDIPAYEETSLSARSFFEVEHSKEVKALEQAARRRRLLARTRTYPHTTQKQED